MLLRKLVFFLNVLGLVVIAELTGCSSSGNITTTPPLPPPNAVIFVATPPTSLAIYASATLAASATYSSASLSSSQNTLVTWSVTCGTSGACGSFSASPEGGAIVYTAPSAIPSGGSVTVTATSVADSTKSTSATITITAPIPISVAFFAPPPASQQVNATFTMSAVINNDVSANPEVKWTATCGGADCGSFSQITTYSEQQNSYIAPATIPPGGTVTVTVTSVTDPTKSASTSIVITAAAPTLANGTYVFQLTGQTDLQSGFIDGVFVANNGVVTGGEQDSISYVSDSDDNSYADPVFQKISGGSYATTSDGNLAVSLQLAPGEVETFSGTLASGAKGFIANIDGAQASGTLDLQTSTAAPIGGYAISLFGSDLYTEPAWVGGVLNIDSPGGISGSGSVLDVISEVSNDTGEQMLGASTVSAPDANGRVQIQLFPSASSTFSPLYLVGYVVDATHIRLIETGDQNDTVNFNGVLGGTALGQGTNTGHFSTASVAGSSYVFGAQGNDTNGALQLAGVLTLNSDGTAAGTLNWNDLSGATAQSPAPFTGSFTVDPTGRVTLSNLADGSAFSYSLHLYLTGDGNGLLLSNESGSIFSGQAFLRQSTPFAAGSFSGNYGLNASLWNLTSAHAGYQPGSANGSITTTAGSGTNAVNGFADVGNGVGDFALSGNFTPDANGIFQGTIAGFDPSSRTTPSNFTLYLVDGTQGVLIETDNAQLTLGRLALVQ